VVEGVHQRVLHGVLAIADAASHARAKAMQVGPEQPALLLEALSRRQNELERVLQRCLESEVLR
jgi:hypothetical protein